MSTVRAADRGAVYEVTCLVRDSIGSSAVATSCCHCLFARKWQQEWWWGTVKKGKGRHSAIEMMASLCQLHIFGLYRDSNVLWLFWV